MFFFSTPDTAYPPPALFFQLLEDFFPELKNSPQVVCTSTMAVGAHKLAASEALVCRLTAIEEIAAMDVLCSDKTGTLTLNKLKISEPWALCSSGSSSSSTSASSSSSSGEDKEVGGWFIFLPAAGRAGFSKHRCEGDHVVRRAGLGVVATTHLFSHLPSRRQTSGPTT